VKCM